MPRIVPRVAGSVFAALLLLAPAVPTRAGSFDNRPKLLVHLVPASVSAKNQCGTLALADCQSATTSGKLVNSPGGPWNYWAYLVAATGSLRDVSLGGNGKGLSAIQVAADYETGQTPGGDPTGIRLFEWNLCATLELDGMPGLPAPGGSTVIVWDHNPQKAELAVAGYFYMGAYSPGTLRLIPRPLDGKAKVADGTSTEIELATADLGYATFSLDGATPGANPCLAPVPVTSTTWSAVKAGYGH